MSDRWLLDDGEVTGFIFDSYAFPVLNLDGTGDQTLTGVLFSRAPTFPAGSVDQQLPGVLFSVPPAFPVGRVDLQLAGALLTVTPTFPAGAVQSNTYYVDPAGDDGDPGTTPGTAWQTLAKVNSTGLSPGTFVYLKRGGVWRESLSQQDGVTFADYDSGDKPSIRGSDTANVGGSWTAEGSLWYLSSITVDPQIFAHDGTLGRRRTSKGALTQNWDYWWDDPNDRFYVYQATGNPTTQASLLEYGVRNRILGAYSGVSCDYENLDVRHNRGDLISGAFSADTLNFTGCDFTQHGQQGFQYHNGGSGIVDGCTFTDWGVAGGSADYAVQVIGFSGTDSGPVDVTGCTFTLTDNNVRSGGDCMAVTGDADGWLREVSDCTIDMNGLGDEAIVSYRPATSATTITITGNTVTDPGGIGIALQELEAEGATPTVVVSGNTITGACAQDRADEEGLRLRNFTSACDVTVHHNVVQTFDGANAHHGIRVTAATGVKVYHNTVYDCDDGIRLDNDVAVRASTANVRNNIATTCRGTEGLIEDSSTFIAEDYNDWHGTVSGFTAGANSITDDPLLTDPGNNDFTLTVGSPCVNTGVVIAGINDGYIGAFPDMGAYEQVPVLTGVLYSRAPTFGTGRVDLQILGVLFTVPPSFPAGAVTPVNTLTGALFTVAPVFPVGIVVGDQTLNGVLLTVPPVFGVGAVDATQTVSGVLFIVVPTFGVGSVTPVNTLAGVLFTWAPTFPAGRVDLQILGVLFIRVPTFPVGAVLPQPVTLAGSLFTVAPTFPAGIATQAQIVAGVLFTVTPVFGVGAVQPQPVTITGVLFSRAPTFPTGSINLQVSGVLLTVTPTFGVGIIASGQIIGGILFPVSPTFGVGVLTLGTPAANEQAGRLLQSTQAGRLLQSTQEGTVTVTQQAGRLTVGAQS